jgi:hypothetical protein
MPRGRGIYDDEKAGEQRGGQTGAAGEGGDGKKTTPDDTPDVAETDQEPTG